jgi:hypothetical protein
MPAVEVLASMQHVEDRARAGLAALYVVPTMIAVIRHVENIGLVVFLNYFPIAWPAAFVVACMMPRKETW